MFCLRAWTGSLAILECDGQGQCRDHLEELHQHPVTPKTGCGERKLEESPPDCTFQSSSLTSYTLVVNGRWKTHIFLM